MALIDKIKDKRAVVGVIGLGYVGLPLAVEKAKAGYRVLGFDVKAEKCLKVNKGENYIGDVVPEELASLVEKGMLRASWDFDGLLKCDVVTICVPTPLDKYKQPDLSYVLASAGEIASRIHKDMLIVLESTTYPGTTEEILKPLFEKSGLKVGRDIFLAFSPERVDPGNGVYKTCNTPKVVGGCTALCSEAAKTLYEAVINAPVTVVSSPKEAEATKILENTFRIVGCALANEMAVMCFKMGINVWEVINAAATKPFGFVPFYPGPGVGGHCIPLDPFYLTYKAREYDYHTRLIELAGEINDSMPDYVVMRLGDILNESSKALRGSSILLSGVAYKGDVDDVRESPALKVWTALEKKGALVDYYDPYCPFVKRPGKTASSVALDGPSIGKYDAVVITSGHKKLVEYGLIAENAKVIFDTKNVLAPALSKNPLDIPNLRLL